MTPAVRFAAASACCSMPRDGRGRFARFARCAQFRDHPALRRRHGARLRRCHRRGCAAGAGASEGADRAFRGGAGCGAAREKKVDRRGARESASFSPAAMWISMLLRWLTASHEARAVVLRFHLALMHICSSAELPELRCSLRARVAADAARRDARITGDSSVRLRSCRSESFTYARCVGLHGAMAFRSPSRKRIPSIRCKLLRLAIHLEAGDEVVRRLFAFVWRDGNIPETCAGLVFSCWPSSA